MPRAAGPRAGDYTYYALRRSGGVWAVALSVGGRARGAGAPARSGSRSFPRSGGVRGAPTALGGSRLSSLAPPCLALATLAVSRAAARSAQCGGDGEERTHMSMCVWLF